MFTLNKLWHCSGTCLVNLNFPSKVKSRINVHLRVEMYGDKVERVGGTNIFQKHIFKLFYFFCIIMPHFD